MLEPLILFLSFMFRLHMVISAHVWCQKDTLDSGITLPLHSAYKKLSPSYINCP
jgi:hypothetical protein